MATAAIKLRAEVACKLCRSVAVKTKGQWLIALYLITQKVFLMAFCEKIGKLRHFFNAFVFIVFCVVAFAVTLPPTCN